MIYIGKLQTFIPRCFFRLISRFSLWNKGFGYCIQICYQFVSVAHIGNTYEIRVVIIQENMQEHSNRSKATVVLPNVFLGTSLSFLERERDWILQQNPKTTYTPVDKQSIHRLIQKICQGHFPGVYQGLTTDYTKGSLRFYQDYHGLLGVNVTTD